MGWEYRIVHATYVSLKDKSEQKLFTIYPFNERRIVIERPQFSNHDINKVLEVAQEKFGGSLIEGIVEFEEKIYVPDPEETKKIQDNLEETVIKNIKKLSHSEKYSRHKR